MDTWQRKQDVAYSLIIAAREGNLERARELINSFGLSYSKKWSQGYILLLNAVKNKHAAVAKLLLTNGSQVNSKTGRPFNTPVHFAVRNGDIEILKMILDRGANVEAKNEYGRTPLHIAVEMEYLKIVEHLLKYGASINCECIQRKDYTPLHFAVEKGSEEAVSLLLSRGANVDAKGKDGITPLHLAAQNEYIRIAEDLLNNGACIDSSTLKEGYTPLHFACDLDNEETVELFLNRGADIHARTKDYSTPLHIATRRQREQSIKLLLQHGAKVDNQDEYGRTILYLAVESGYLTIFQDILKYCSDINNRLEDANIAESLHVAVEKGHLIMVEDLLKYGADVNMSYNSTSRGCTLLGTAVKYKQEEVAKLLIRYKADVNGQDRTRETPISRAVQNADSKITKLLLSNGANIPDIYRLLNSAVDSASIDNVETLLPHVTDINSSNGYGSTALHLTAMSKSGGFFTLGTNNDPDIDINGQIAKLLVSRGANVNAKRKDGMTTLHIAAQNGYKQVVEALLECGAVDSKIGNDMTTLHLGAKTGYPKITDTISKFGADIPSRNENGRTALHLASGNGHDDIVATLLEYGSDINITSGRNRTPLDYALAGMKYPYSKPHYYESDDDDDYYFHHDPHRSVCNFKQTVEVLERHIIKLKTANLYVSEKNLLSLRRSDEISVFQDKCEEEIVSMKNEMISNLRISFYDILARDTSSLATYMKNDHVVQVLKSDDYKTKFPIYASIIKSNFRKGMERKELLEQGNKIFHIFFNNVAELPYDCAEKIISYLSDQDLRNLIDAYEPLDISNPNNSVDDVVMPSRAAGPRQGRIEE